MGKVTYEYDKNSKQWIVYNEDVPGIKGSGATIDEALHELNQYIHAILGAVGGNQEEEAEEKNTSEEKDWD